MKSLYILFFTMPMLILGTTLALLIHSLDSDAAIIIDPHKNTPIAFHQPASMSKISRQEAKTASSIAPASENPRSIRHELVCWALNKLPIAEPIHLTRYSLQTTAVLLFGLGIFGVSSFLRNIFRIR